LFTPVFWKKIGLSFARAFIATFVLGVGGAFDAVASGDTNAARSAAVALVVAGVTAGIRAAQALFTNLEPAQK
jgi:hypothetical protein